MKLLTTIILSVLFLSACNNHADVASSAQTKPAFTYFEFSYYSGWGGVFSLTVDTAKQVRFRKSMDSVYYKRLPDSIYNEAEILATALLQTGINRNDSLRCADCSIVAFIIKNNKDSIMHIYADPPPYAIRHFRDMCSDFIKQNSSNGQFEYWLPASGAAIMPRPPSVNELSDDEE